MLRSLLFAGLFIAGFAQASAELDHKYAMESVGFLKSWDNVDGLFADYVASGYKEYFSRQSRFVLIDLTKADAVMSRSKLSYAKIIEDTQVLGSLARASRSHTLIRTKILKEGSQYRFTLDWLHAPLMDLIASESFVLEERHDGQNLGFADINDTLRTALDKLIKRAPFIAHVTGRDGPSVTINIGANASLKVGDTLLVGSLDEVKRHPLLKSIVDWRLTPTGKLSVEQVDEGIAFCKVIEEEPNRKISRYQKIAQILPKPLTPLPLHEGEGSSGQTPPDDRPKLGWVTAGLDLGTYSRQFAVNSNGSTTTGRTGSSILYGARTEGQLWLDRRWFAEFGTTYGLSSYSQKDLANASAEASGAVSIHVFTYRLAVGYKYLPSGDFYGSSGWIKLGYKSTSYSFPNSVDLTELESPSSFKSGYIGIGGSLPIVDPIGVELGLDFGIFSSATQSGTPADTTTTSSPVTLDPTGASDIAFHVSPFYRLSPQMSAVLGIHIQANDIDVTTPATLSQKMITIAPAILYYF